MKRTMKPRVLLLCLGTAWALNGCMCYDAQTGEEAPRNDIYAYVEKEHEAEVARRKLLERKNPVLVFSEYSQGEINFSTRPLPREIPIQISKYYSDDRRESWQGYRGWDYDRDGFFDMLEVIDANGETSIYAYDFNGDGKVDFMKKRVD